MPDRENVIKGLEGMIDYFFNIYRNNTDSYKCAKAQEYSDCAIDAIALLKEQEAVEPTFQQGKAYCGKCGCRIPDKIKARFCHKCGKKIKWHSEQHEETANHC